jgi:hypothetical protein
MIYRILLLVLFVPLVIAFNSNLGTLTFLLEQNEELCQVVDVGEHEEVFYLYDVWSGESEDSLDNGGFEFNYSDHNLSVNYPKEVQIEVEEIDVCVSGSKVGEFFGKIVFEGLEREISLNVVVEKPSPQDQGPTVTSPGSGGGGGSKLRNKDDSALDNVNDDIIIEEEKIEELEIEELSQELEDLEVEGFFDSETEGDGENYRILDGDIEVEKITIWNFIPVAFIVFLVAARVYVAKKRKKKL